MTEERRRVDCPEQEPWPEVDVPRGWKKNPRAGKRLTRLLLLTVLISGAVTVLSAGRSEVLPVVCFLALVLLPLAGPALSGMGLGANSREASRLHTATPADIRT